MKVVVEILCSGRQDKLIVSSRETLLAELISHVRAQSFRHLPVKISVDGEITIALLTDHGYGEFELHSLLCACGDLFWQHEFDSGDPDVGMQSSIMCSARREDLPDGFCECFEFAPRETSGCVSFLTQQDLDDMTGARTLVDVPIRGKE